jgi:ribose 5-phosphate isomerase B
MPAENGTISQLITRRSFIGTVAAAPLLTMDAQAAPATPTKWKLVVGCDHAGFPLKGPLIQALRSWGHTVTDIGVYNTTPVDFPDIAQKLSNEILSGRCQRGIMVCGTGVGAAIAVNKVHGMRATLCHDTYCAHQCVEHDNVNVICMGAWIIGPRLAEEVMRTYLNAHFDSADPDLRRRVEKLHEMEMK